MDLFFLSSASGETPLLAALLVGILLLVGGLLLLFLPRVERQKPSSRWRSKSPVPTLPGYRIRSEQARTPGQFLAVSRIAALEPPRTPQPPEAPEMGTRIEEEQTLELPQTIAAPIEEQPTHILIQPEAEQQTVPETLLDEQAVSAEPAVPAPMGDEEYLPAQPVSLPTLHVDEMAALEQEPAAPLPESAADFASEAAPQTATSGHALAPEQTSAQDQPDLSAQGEEPPVSTAAPPIRKARLASVLAEPARERSFAKEALPGGQPPLPPEPQPPQSAARRAHLTGFPAPAAWTTTVPTTEQREEPEPQQPTAAPSGDHAPGEAEAPPETSAADGPEDEAGVVISPPLQQESAAIKSPPVVRVVCFGTVDILLGGAPLSPLDSRFRSSREFELMAFLAQSAALRRQSFVDRSTITEALLSEGLEEEVDDADGEGEAYRRSPLGGWKYRLCRRLRHHGVPDHAWLETRADGALRLRSDVQIDLVEFLQVSSQLRKARDAARRSGEKPIERETVVEWLQQLQHLYRDRGEFAEQFKLQEWTQEPRRRYQNMYWHALFYAAELLASLGERQTAIQLAEELVEQEEVETEVIYEALLIWLHEDGNKSDLSRWLNRYREWYAAAHDDRSLDTARPELMRRLGLGTSPAARAQEG